MKRIVIILSVLALAITASAARITPRHEARASWFQTVWRGDFPTNPGTSATAISQQKQQLTRWVGYFRQYRMNMMWFQVRSMCDAMYQSSYPEEAWSQWLTNERGVDPGYDPLAFLISEAHAQGIEVHAWLNPYRYATSVSTYGTQETDYSHKHPDWLSKCTYTNSEGITTTTWILNPGNPAVRQRIVDVVMDIVNRYDIDGIVFDDYFYQNGFRDEDDEALYQSNNPTNLSRGDWRREQVNMMVHDVNAAIKAVKPWVRFGIGPAGVAASSTTVANKYGVDPCPGYDWQYNEIYSDPLAWISRHDLDYISPQVYWKIGATSDYAQITPWWYDVCYKFDRNCYISTSLSSLNTWLSQEYINQIAINRASTHTDVSGMVFFNTKPWINSASLKAKLDTNAYKYYALPPELHPFKTDVQGMVTDLAVAGSTLTWSYTDNSMRYAIYCIPHAERHKHEALATSKYLTDITYNKQYILPSGVTTSTHAIAVAVLDRYGHEYAMRFVGEGLQSQAQVVLSYPANGAGAVLPNILTWQPITDASGYTVQISKSQTFNDVLVMATADTCAFNTNLYSCLRSNGTLYWRVRANAANTPSVWSAIHSFTAKSFSILSPQHGESGVSVTPTITWDNAGSGVSYSLDIAISNKFTATGTVYTTTTTSTSAKVPTSTLKYGTHYFARVRVNSPMVSTITEAVEFVTDSVSMEAPVLLSPANGDNIVAQAITLTANVTPNNGYRFELCQREDFPIRSTKRKTTALDVNKVTYEDMTEGTWYARVAVLETADGTKLSDYSPIVQFTYTIGTGIADVKVTTDNAPRKVATPVGIRVRRGEVEYDLKGRRIK